MDFSKEINASMKDLVEDISALCKINSVEGEPKPGMPFGEGPAKALDAALAIGERMGMKTENFDHYVGHIEYGQGEEMVGILAHVDVVPSGDGWDGDPWGGEVRDGKIWGRGTLDDKGPLMACLYAVNILKEMNVPLSKRIRFIIGTNEETNWKCMEYYAKNVKPEYPTCAFSPDAEFPVTYAEKGILQYSVKKTLTETIQISGGNAVNSVPSSAQVVLPASILDDLVKAISDSEEGDLYQYQQEGDQIVLTTKGIGAHAMSPEKGKNAISFMMKLLAKLPLDGELAELSKYYSNKFATTTFGEQMGVDISDDISGPMTLNVGQILVEGNELHIKCDSRVPVTVDMVQREAVLKDKLSTDGFTFSLDDKIDSLYVPKDSELVTTLMNAYRTVTGDLDAEPMTSGGATYSRTMDNCVAFGCLLPDQEDLMHQANECLEIDKLELWVNICLEAIYQLAK
ncbi:succinyl-diaminopimelate desuccinylase [Clostridiales Family XIII bacterium PM5-7]